MKETKKILIKGRSTRDGIGEIKDKGRFVTSKAIKDE